MTPELGPPIEVVPPHAARVPLVVSSPHSGQFYPPGLLGAVQVDLALLRRLEDGPVDRLFGCAPALGAPLLRARFARAYVDPNRDAFELDRELFAGALPDHVDTGSIKARAGLGTIPSRIGGQPIYRAPLGFAEAERRLRLAYWPYHQALQGLLAKARAEFGSVLLLDCHSMPGLTANGAAREGGEIDVALGDRFGRSCAPVVIERAEQMLRRHGFRVARNRPYAGGYITARYGQPDADLHALQIEVRRGLYMDERSLRPLPAMARLQETVRELLAELAQVILRQPARGPALTLGLSTAS